MPAKPKGKKDEETIDVLETTHGYIDVCMVGTVPGMLHNRPSEKTRRQLLLPPRKKNAAERATTLKHDPLEEFRASPYRLSDPEAPTLLAHKGAAFHKAMMAAALDLPSTKKAVIGRLTWVEGDYVPIYGIPQIHSDIVRSSDIARTPDVRFRAITPAWACRLRVTYVKPLMQSQAVVRLLAAAGLYIGVGDGRQEKGALHHGGWRLVEADDPTFTRILAEGGREAQTLAMESPVPYDDETAELLGWFDAEIRRREMRGVS